MLAEIGRNQRVTQDFATAVHIQRGARILGKVGCDGLKPVHVGIELGVITRTRTLDNRRCVNIRTGTLLLGIKFVQEIHVVGRSSELGKLRRRLDRLLDTEVYTRLPDLTALGREDDNTVGTAHTVHGARRCILQHRERLDLLNIKVIQRTLDTIDQHKRRRGTLIRRNTANPEARSIISGLARRTISYDTGDLTGKGVTDVSSSTHIEVLWLHSLNGTYDRGSLLGTVSSNHNVVQTLRALFHLDIDHGLRSDLDRLRLISEALEYNLGRGGNLN